MIFDVDILHVGSRCFCTELVGFTDICSPGQMLTGQMLTGQMLTGQMLTGQMLTGQMLTPLSKNRTNAHKI